MPIKGDLTRIDLANIFQMLTLNQNVGTLDIFFGGTHKSIYFSGNGIIIPYDQDTMEDRVISLLFRQGKLSEEQIERARYNTSSLNTGLLGALLQMRYVSEEDVSASYFTHMEEDFYDLFLVKDANFEFLEDEKPSGKQKMDERYILSPNSVLMEAVRRGDEWAHIQQLVPSDVEVFEIVDPTLPEGVKDPNGEYELVLKSLDGIHSVKRVIEISKLHRFTVFKNISILVESGKIVPVDFTQLVARADETMKASRTQDAIDLYERAIAGGVDSLDLFEKVGEAYKSISENKKAVSHLYKLCEAHETLGSLKQAIKFYMNIRELMPTEIIARERIFQLYLNNREIFEEVDYDPVAEGRQLTLLFKEIGRTAHAKEIVNMLFEKNRENNDLLENLSKLAIDIQQPALALSILEHLGNNLLYERDSTNSLRIFRKIKCIDPEHRGVDDKLDRLMEDDLTTRNKRGHIIRTSMLIGALVIIIGGYFLFNTWAYEAYTTISYEDLIASNNFAQARNEYDSFCAKFPFSIYWFLAKERLSSIESAQERYDSEMALRAKYSHEEKNHLQKNAENLFVDAMAALDSSNLTEALKLLKKVDESSSDETWRQGKNIEEKIKEIETYFQEAKDLRIEAEKLVKTGKYPEAHALLSRVAIDYNKAPSSSGVKLPVLVKSNPPGARILVNNEEVRSRTGNRKAITPEVVEILPSRHVQITVEKEGFMAESYSVNIYEKHDLNFEMRFQSERTCIIGPSLAYPPIVIGKKMILGYKTGRIKCYDPEADKILWTYEIKNLKSLESPLCVSGNNIYFCWGRNNISALNIKDTSKPLWEKKLPSVCSLLPVESCGMIAFPLDEGKVVFVDPKSGDIKKSIVLPAKPILDPISWDKGIILAMNDGYVVWIDCTEEPKIKEKRLLSTSPVSQCYDSGEIIIGNAQGGIDCFKVDSAKLVYSYQADIKKPVNQIVVNGTKTYIVIDDRTLLSLDTRDPSKRLAVCGEFPPEDPSNERDYGSFNISHKTGGATLAVGSSDSSMYLLGATDLSVTRVYRANGKILFTGVVLGDYIYFYSDEGALKGLRY